MTLVAGSRRASIRASTRAGASRRLFVRSKQDVIGNVANVAVGADGNDRHRDADRLRQRRESVARQGGRAAAGTGGSRGARRRTRTNRPRRCSSKASCSGCSAACLGLGLARRRPALPRGGRPGDLCRAWTKSPSTRARSRFTLAVSLLSGIAVRPDPGLEVRRTAASPCVLRGGGRDVEPEQGASSGTQHPGRRPGRDGAGAAGGLRVDDSHVPGVARRSSQGSRKPERAPDDARSRFQRSLGPGTGTSRTTAERHRGQAGGDSRRDVRGLRERDAHGGAHAGLGLRHARGQDVPKPTRFRRFGSSSRSRPIFFRPPAPDWSRAATTRGPISTTAVPW